MNNKLLFCNIGWMEHYQGITTYDHIVGGGKNVALKGLGGEVCNFLPLRGQCFGFVQPRGAQANEEIAIHIGKLEANKDDAYVDNIDVVVTALKPGGGTYIVGWYKNARVFREKQALIKPSKIHSANKVKSFRFQASCENVTLLPVDLRTVRVPRGKDGMGTANIWYPDVNKNKTLIDRIRKLIKSGSDDEIPKKATHKAQIIPDLERKALVEKIAISEVVRFFQSKPHNYNVDSKEKDNLGWDLEATKGDSRLLIEVKGRSINSIHAELTPNEYAAFKKNKTDYRLCIVTNCLSKPRLYVFQYNFSSENWICKLGKKIWTLEVTEKTGAVVSS